MKAVDKAGGPSLETLERPEYSSPDPALVADTERLILFCYLLGQDHASSPLNLADEEWEAVPFEEAEKFMKARVPMAKAEWKKLEPEVRFRAFTVAALSTPDAIEKVRKEAIRAVEEGKPFAEFWTEVTANEVAGLGKSPAYWETVYRTNVQTAYNAGRAAEFKKSQPEYLEFVGIEDTRQTSICAERSGVILPATHPFWKTAWPPLHFKCRSSIRGVYREEVEELRETGDWKQTDDDTLEEIPSPGKGFGGNPIETGSFWKMTSGMVQRAEEYDLIEDIRGFAKDIGLKYDPLMTSTMGNDKALVKSRLKIPAGKEERNILRDKLTKRLIAMRDTSIQNAYLKEEVTLNRTGIDKAISFSGSPAKLAAINSLPTVIKKAVIIGKEADTKHPEFSEVLKGRIAIEHGGNRNLFEVVLKRQKSSGKLVFYEILPYVMK